MNVIDRIELTARRALDNKARAGAALGWYADARQWIASVADSLDIAPERIAGFVAALSPQNAWTDQLRWIPEQLKAARAALESSPDAPVELLAQSIPGQGFRANKTKALRILQGEPPLAVLSGDKVRAFFANLTGNETAVTVDRHAFAVAFGPAFVGYLTAARYRMTADAYRTVALRLGITPAACQALCWVYFKATEKDGEPW